MRYLRGYRLAFIFSCCPPPRRSEISERFSFSCHVFLESTTTLLLPWCNRATQPYRPCLALWCMMTTMMTMTSLFSLLSHLFSIRVTISMNHHDRSCRPPLVVRTFRAILVQRSDASTYVWYIPRYTKVVFLCPFGVWIFGSLGTFEIFRSFDILSKILTRVLFFVRKHQRVLGVLY